MMSGLMPLPLNIQVHTTCSDGTSQDFLVQHTTRFGVNIKLKESAKIMSPLQTLKERYAAKEDFLHLGRDLLFSGFTALRNHASWTILLADESFKSCGSVGYKTGKVFGTLE